MLEGFDLKKMGHNSPAYIHTLAEALKLALADRDRYYGDPNFVKIPTAELLSKNYAALRRPLIDERHASLAQQPGDPLNMKAVLASAVQTIGKAPRTARDRARQRYDVRQRRRQRRQYVQRDAEWRLAARSRCRRYGRIDGPETAVVADRSKQSERRRTG